MVSPTSATLQVGQTQQLSAATLSSGGGTLTGRTVAWTSSDLSIATVSTTGLVTGVKPATATISATSESKSGIASITVTPGALATVRVNLTDTVIVMGRTTRASVQLLDANGNAISNTPVIYASSDTNIALVDASGGIAGVYEGKVTIRATAGDKIGTASLTVLLDPTVAAAYWKRVPNAFPDLSSYIAAIGGGAFMTAVVKADLNRDGRPDLVFHLWHFRTPLENATIPVGASVPNRLVALIANADGTYSDRTQELFGTRDVDIAGAASRKVRVADLNGDGFPDWVYATHHEDGRPCVSGPGGCSWTAPNAAVLSTGDGSYRVVTFGDTAYHHSVEFVRKGPGNFHLLSNQDGAYAIVGSSFQKIGGYPWRSGDTIHAFSISGSASSDEYLLADVPDYPRPNPLVLFDITAAPAREVARFQWESISQIKQIDGGRDTSLVWAKTYQGQVYISGGFYESCTIHPTPGQAPVLVVSLASHVFPDGVVHSSFVNGSLFVWNRLLTFNTSPPSFQSTAFIPDASGPFNINNLDCVDVNGDGYEDLATYPYRSGAKPNVYVNNRSGALAKISDTLLPDGPTGNQWTATFVDSDGDGVQDLVYFPGNGCSVGQGCATFQLWKGRRPLQLPSAATRARLRTP